MPVAEIAAAITGIRSAFDITKAMADLRDAEAFRAKGPRDASGARGSHTRA